MLGILAQLSGSRNRRVNRTPRCGFEPIRTGTVFLILGALAAGTLFVAEDIRAQTPPDEISGPMVDKALFGGGAAKGTATVSFNGHTATIRYDLNGLIPDSPYNLLFFCQQMSGLSACDTRLTYQRTGESFPARVFGPRTSDHSGALLVDFVETDLPAGSYYWHAVASKPGVETLNPEEVDVNQHIHTLQDISFTSTGEPPTCLPANSVTPATAFEPLVDTGNLLRVWYFDPATQDNPPRFGWGLYDPRPLFSPANTVTEMVEGRFYWALIKSPQRVVLNCQPRNMYAGWNPVTW